MWKFPHQKLASFKKIFEMLFTATYFSHKLENSSWIFCPELSEEALVYFYLSPYPLGLKFLQILIFWKLLWMLKVTFKATEFWQTTEFTIFQKALFLTFAWSIIMVLKAAHIVSGPNSLRFFTFSSNSFIFISCIFKAVKIRSKFFMQPWTKYFKRLSHFGMVFLHHK